MGTTIELFWATEIRLEELFIIATPEERPFPYTDPTVETLIGYLLLSNLCTSFRVKDFDRDIGFGTVPSAVDVAFKSSGSIRSSLALLLEPSKGISDNPDTGGNTSFPASAKEEAPTATPADLERI